MISENSNIECIANIRNQEFAVSSFNLITVYEVNKIKLKITTDGVIRCLEDLNETEFAGGLEENIFIWKKSNGKLIKTLKTSPSINFLTRISDKLIMSAAGSSYNNYNFVLWNYITGEKISSIVENITTVSSIISLKEKGILFFSGYNFYALDIYTSKVSTSAITDTPVFLCIKINESEFISANSAGLMIWIYEGNNKFTIRKKISLEHPITNMIQLDENLILVLFKNTQNKCILRFYDLNTENFKSLQVDSEIRSVNKLNSNQISVMTGNTIFILSNNQQ